MIDAPASFDALLRETAERAQSGSLKEYLRIFQDNKPCTQAWIAEYAPQIRIPQRLGTFDSIDDIDFEALPDHFVLKPAFGFNARGMFCIERLGQDRFLDIYRNKEFSGTEIRQQYEAERAASRVGYNQAVLIEERIIDALLPGIPMDYKFHCFHGQCPFVMQRYVPSGGKFKDTRFRFLDESGEDLGAIKFADRYDASLPHTPLLREAFQIAKNISAKIALPFIRVDLYITPTEVVFGELTALPNGGKDYFVAEWDQRLGQFWLEAEARLEGGKT